MFDFGKNPSKYIHRNTAISIIAGILFATGWWIMIDMNCQYPAQSDFNKFYYIIGIVATLALMLANCVSKSQITNPNDDVKMGARLVLFIAFILVFGSFIASIWVLFGYYVINKKENLYPGLAIFGQNLAILISTLILKLGRKEIIRY